MDNETNSNMPAYTWCNGGLQIDTFLKIEDAYIHAKNKHPEFAVGVYHALGFLSEEHGEVVKEITKGKDGWEERMDKELIDLIVVAIRMLNREYKGCSYG